MTLYEINQLAYARLPKMTGAEIEKAKIPGVFPKDYYMLLCRELNDYTVFRIGHAAEDETIWNSILDILSTRGTLKGIETKEDGTIEFWITSKKGTNMYLLFPYDWGVINVE